MVVAARRVSRRIARTHLHEICFWRECHILASLHAKLSEAHARLLAEDNWIQSFDKLTELLLPLSIGLYIHELFVLFILLLNLLLYSLSKQLENAWAYLIDDLLI